MSQYSTLYVGLDVHKDTIVIAAIGNGDEQAVVDLGTISTRHYAIDKLLKKLQGMGSELRLVYEAGPTGYWLQRLIETKGHRCQIISPSLLPKAAGDRVKTDRRDARSLAMALKMGAVDGIHIPTVGDEAIRDVSRAWQQARVDARKTKQRIKMFLLRHDVRYTGQARWSAPHRRWLSEQRMSNPASQIVLQELIETLGQHERRSERLEKTLKDIVHDWRFGPVVQALQAFRGIQFLTALTMIAELGDLNRFDHPKKLMAYVGLVPGERSSGQTRKLGPITRCGNSHVRTLLVESAWSYHYSPKVSRQISQRQEGIDPDIIEIAWEAQTRLHRRYMKLKSRGMHQNKVITAVARELIGFIWAAAQQVPLAPEAA